MSVHLWEGVAFLCYAAAAVTFILLFCLAHRALFALADRWRWHRYNRQLDVALDNADNLLACRECGHLCIPGTDGLCNTCAATADALFEAEVNRLLKEAQA